MASPLLNVVAQFAKVALLENTTATLLEADINAWTKTAGANRQLLSINVQETGGNYLATIVYTGG